MRTAMNLILRALVIKMCVAAEPGTNLREPSKSEPNHPRDAHAHSASLVENPRGIDLLGDSDSPSGRHKHPASPQKPRSCKILEQGVSRRFTWCLHRLESTSASEP